LKLQNIEYQYFIRNFENSQNLLKTHFG